MRKNKKGLNIRMSIDYYNRGVPQKQLYYDSAVSNNGKCYFCKKPIPKGVPIFWFWAAFKKHNKDKEKKDTDLNIKRKICFRCIEEDVFNHVLKKYQDEIIKIKKIRKSFRRSLKGMKCKRAIENLLVLEELQKEDFSKNFDYNKFHG